ncbi:hypothetical protein [Nocardiopsis alba]|uniref:hypothetical protein n=1 Tax=Nocardiopsis alba TaxID=53437 RepID=UPI0033ED1FA8
MGGGLAAYTDSAQRAGGFLTNGRAPKAEVEKPENLPAILSLTAVMHDYLIRTEVESGRFVVRGAHEKWTRGTYLCLFIDVREVDEDFRDTTPWNLDIRLVDTPCFVKLCAPQTRMPSTPDLVASMYFTREHF